MSALAAGPVVRRGMEKDLDLAVLSARCEVVLASLEHISAQVRVLAAELDLVAIRRKP